ncbi:PIN domain-containing protein [Nostoc sp. FACHB-280]|uniref:PIN domain-containing protein n=1 Tax=Nostoc sp. FACHB-280 TaxID=2692839 RepID=UPI00168BD79F|nr:PIN domain-containing protein [Nostoc sp. FACHB-280]MBD2495096.1 PIN domain-containing protein [Nostoc sp. FACHB-280]
MSGSRYLLDTNAIVALLQGNSKLLQLLQNADWIGISIISQIEFLAFSGLSQADIQVFQQFLQRVEVVSLIASDTVLIQQIIQLRQQYRLKLPDAIIAAMAFQSNAKLVTADQEFAKVSTLTVINW